MNNLDVRDVAKEPVKAYVCVDDVNNFPGSFYSAVLGEYITKVIYNKPYTIVFWSDGTKTMTKAMEGDKYNKESGLALCVLKKLVGASKVRNLFEAWIPAEEQKHITVTLKDVRKSQKKKQ